VAHVACMEVMRNSYKILAGKPGGKRPLGGPRRRWEDNIRIILRGIMWEVLYWINPTQHRS